MFDRFEPYRQLAGSILSETFSAVVREARNIPLHHVWGKAQNYMKANKGVITSVELAGGDRNVVIFRTPLDIDAVTFAAAYQAIAGRIHRTTVERDEVSVVVTIYTNEI